MRAAPRYAAPEAPGGQLLGLPGLAASGLAALRGVGRRVGRARAFVCVVYVWWRWCVGGCSCLKKPGTHFTHVCGKRLTCLMQLKLPELDPDCITLQVSRVAVMCWPKGAASDTHMMRIPASADTMSRYGPKFNFNPGANLPNVPPSPASFNSEAPISAHLPRVKVRAIRSW